MRTLTAGGVEVGLVNLVRGLDAAGFQQGVCCLEEKGPLASRLPASVPVWSCRAATHSRWRRHEFKAASVIRQYRPQVIHARNIGAWIDTAFARSVALAGGKLAFTIEGWDSVSRIPRRRALLCRCLASLTQGMAAVSSRTGRDFADETGIDVSRFRILRHGVDTERFCPREIHSSPGEGRRERPFVIGCVARLDPIKSHSTLIEAFKSLKARIAGDVELRLIGDGPLRDTLRQQVEQSNLTRSVRFLGTCDDLPEQLRGLDMFVLASDREGRPISVMEAMAAGLPVVATKVGSIEELVDDGESGFLVQPGEAGQLADAMEKLIQHAELRAKMGAAARKKALGSFSLERMCRDYENFYRDVMSGSVGRSSSSLQLS